MRDLRIVFMGTPEFAVHTLAAILEAGYNIVGVITAPDKPAGRGRKLQESAVKKYAVEHNLPLLQPTNLKEDFFLEQLKEWRPNLQVVVAFRMLPKSVWSLPELGTFNLHASLLPEYRGAAPINWAIIQGETLTGVSTFFLDEKIDTGEMILQKEVSISEEDNAGSLHDKLMVTGAELVLETLERIKIGRVETIAQKESSDLKEAKKLNKDNTRIDWTAPLQTIFNTIRGLSPYPGAWTVLKDNEEEYTIKIYKASKEIASHSLQPGSVLQNGKSVKIAVREGYLNVLEIQFPGKRKMPIKDFLNGYRFSPEAKTL